MLPSSSASFHAMYSPPLKMKTIDEIERSLKGKVVEDAPFIREPVCTCNPFRPEIRLPRIKYKDVLIAFYLQNGPMKRGTPFTDMLNTRWIHPDVIDRAIEHLTMDCEWLVGDFKALIKGTRCAVHKGVTNANQP